MFRHVYLCVHMYHKCSAHRGQERAPGLPGDGGTESCEPPDFGDENWTWVFRKSSSAFSCRAISPAIYIHIYVCVYVYTHGILNTAATYKNTQSVSFYICLFCLIHVFQLHPLCCKCHDFVFLYGCTIFHCVCCVPHLLYPFIYWWVDIQAASIPYLLWTWLS